MATAMETTALSNMYLLISVSGGHGTPPDHCRVVNERSGRCNSHRLMAHDARGAVRALIFSQYAITGTSLPFFRRFFRCSQGLVPPSGPLPHIPSRLALASFSASMRQELFMALGSL